MHNLVTCWAKAAEGMGWGRKVGSKTDLATLEDSAGRWKPVYIKSSMRSLNDTRILVFLSYILMGSFWKRSCSIKLHISYLEVDAFYPCQDLFIASGREEKIGCRVR